MRVASTRRAVTLAAAIFLVAGAARGEGESRRFSIHPSLRVTGVADDNVFKRDDHTEGDLGVWIAPRLETTFRTRSLEVGADLGADVRRYLEHRWLDDEFFRARGWVELGILSGLTLTVSDEYVPQPVRLGVPEDEGDNLVQTNRLQAKAEYWRELPGGRELEVGVEGTRLFAEGFASDVPTGGGLVSERNFEPDYWEGGGWVELRSPFGRRTSAFLRTQARYRTYLESSQLDHTDFAALIGLRSRRIRNVELALSGGYGLVNYDSRGVRSRFVGEGSVRVRLPRGFSVRLGGQSRFAPDLTGNDFTETGGRLTLEKRFGERTAASLTGFVSEYENEAFDSGKNLFGGLEAELRRQLSRRVQLALTYRYWNNGGDYGLDDFRQNRLAIVLTYRR